MGCERDDCEGASAAAKSPGKGVSVHLGHLHIGQQHVVRNAAGFGIGDHVESDVAVGGDFDAGTNFFEMEGDESLESAVLREVREETGFEASNPRYLFSIPNRYTYHGVKYTTVDVFFLCDLAAEAEFTPNSEASALEWLALDEVNPGRIAFDSTRSALVRLLGL